MSDTIDSNVHQAHEGHHHADLTPSSLDAFDVHTPSRLPCSSLPPKHHVDSQLPIQDSHKYLGAPAPTELQIEAVKYVQEVAGSEKLRFDFTLQPGELNYIYKPKKQKNRNNEKPFYEEAGPWQTCMAAAQHFCSSNHGIEFCK